MSELPAAVHSEGTAPQAPTVPAKPRVSAAKRRRRIRRVIKWVTWALILCALAVGGFAYYNSTQKNAADLNTQSYIQAVVRQGPLDVHVYGTGAIAAASQPVIYSQTDGKLTDIRVAVGDAVTEGQILAVLQNDALNDEIASLEYELWNADNTITTTSPGSDVSSILAPSAGRVMQISAAAGDDALAVYRRLGSVAMLSTDGRMKVSIDVAEGVALSYGDVVTVSGQGFACEGSVTDLFMQGTRAVVTVVDDTLPLNAQVVVTAQGVAVGRGTLEINKPMAVSAFGGTIKTVRVKVGDTVSRKQEMFTLEDSPITLKVENLRIQRETAAEALQEARDKRENLIIRSPVNGVVATVDATEGSDLVSGDALCSILEGEDMVLTIAVDELDVVKVAEGQSVTISVDALPELLLTGQVQKISPVGTSSGGVSTYDVKLSFDSAGTGVRPGMNASGEVQVAHVDSTLYVPVEALMTMGNQQYVMVADAQYSSPGYSPNAYGDATAQFAGAQDGTTADGSSSRRQALGSGQTAVQGSGQWGPNGTTGGSGNFPAGQGNFTGAQGNLPSDQGNFSGNQGNFPPDQRSFSGNQGSASVDQGNLPAIINNTGASSEQSTEVTGTLRAVSVGLVNDDYAEILSGLNAGEVVLFESAIASSNSSPYGMRNSTLAMPMMGF